jgi:hypothetical protein
VDDTLKSVKPWVTFAGGVLVVAVLYWAQAVLVPFALAILLTFVLTPPVAWGTGKLRGLTGKGGRKNGPESSRFRPDGSASSAISRAGPDGSPETSDRRLCGLPGAIS